MCGPLYLKMADSLPSVAFPNNWKLTGFSRVSLLWSSEASPVLLEAVPKILFLCATFYLSDLFNNGIWSKSLRSKDVCVVLFSNEVVTEYQATSAK